MRWINTDVGTLRAPEFIGSTPAERGTWFCVLGYSVEQENGGRIKNAIEWKDRQWQQTAGVTLREVRAADQLLKWDADDLIVMFYPVEKENEVKAKRVAGSSGGKASGMARAKQSGSKASSTACDSASTERKEKESNTPIVPKGTDSPAAVSPAAQALLRARGLFRIRPSTPLDSGEERAWKKNKGAVAATAEDEWQALEWWYRQPNGPGEAAEYRRTQLSTLLNNWHAEIGKAKAAAAAAGVRPGPKKERVTEPEGWRDLLGAADPEMALPATFGELTESLRAYAWELDSQRKKEGGDHGA